MFPRLAPDEQAALLAANLQTVAEDLESGAIVTIARGRMRIRSLPIVPADCRVPVVRFGR